MPALDIEKLVKKAKPAEAAEAPGAPAEDGLSVAMDEFATACSAKDIAGMARAFRSAFTMLESEPHVEGPHAEPSEE